MFKIQILLAVFALQYVIFSLQLYFLVVNIIQYMNSDMVPKQHQLNLHLNQDLGPNYKSLQSKKSKEVTKGRWNKVEELKYFLFLYHYRKEFSQDQVRRSQRMCKRMSVYIKTRNSIQCRLHHKRTTEKYGGVDQSIESFRKNCPSFQDKYQKIKNYLQVLQDRAFCGDDQCYDSPQKFTQTQKLNFGITHQKALIQKQQKQEQAKTEMQGRLETKYQETKLQQNVWNNLFQYPIIWQPVIFTQSLLYQA